ncbi:MAG: hypothetical protein Q9181_001197 [Wetmoreana brouardii]
MAQLSKSHSPTFRELGDDILRSPNLTLGQMKSMLQTAEQRLTALVPPQTQSRALDRSSYGNMPHSLLKLDHILSTEHYLTVRSGLARIEPSKTVHDDERQLSNRAQVAIQPRTESTKSKQHKNSTGPDWYYLPRTNLTPELKRDLQMLKMRSIWDPKRHYKNDNRKPLIPEYCQVGTIFEGPTEFYSSRIPKHHRKKSFVEGILAGEESTGRFKSRYNNIQNTKNSGRRAFYNNLKQKRFKRSMKR